MLRQVDGSALKVEDLSFAEGSAMLTLKRSKADWQALAARRRTHIALPVSSGRRRALPSGSDPLLH
eukprot:22527-Amphidinium_carterae.1